MDKVGREAVKKQTEKIYMIIQFPIIWKHPLGPLFLVVFCGVSIFQFSSYFSDLFHSTWLKSFPLYQ